MKTKIMELKEELKQLAKDIRLLKYTHRANCRNGLLLCPWVIEHGYYSGKNIKFWLEEYDWIHIDSTPISKEILNEFKNMQKMAVQDHCLLVEKQFLCRHLFIVYGLLRGKTREYMEPKWRENPTNWNQITRKYILGKDPVDWNFISELKKKYSELIGDCTVLTSKVG